MWRRATTTTARHQAIVATILMGGFLGSGHLRSRRRRHCRRIVPGASRPGSVRSDVHGAKTPGGARKPGAKTVRVQLHLGEQVTRRLDVHAALVGRNSSRVAEEIL